MSQHAVQVSGVTKRYGDFIAVDDVSFAVPRGVIYALLGPNGAGKTTLVRMLNDILVPDEGEIRLLGDLRPGRAAAARIGYLPEERGLYPKMRVGEVLVFFGELRGLTGREAARRADQWLERLGIADWKKNKVQDLSKGMQQKVQFATALLHDPDLLILDEPWSGLDPINADVLREVVLEQKRAGKTILFSTHLMEQAEKICDEVCILARGRKALDGTLTAIKREAASDRSAIVELVDEAARARAETTVLADPALVAATRPRPGGLEVELADGATVAALLAALVAAELPLRRFEIFEPSLHQIFVDRVGERATAAVEGRRAP